MAKNAGRTEDRERLSPLQVEHRLRPACLTSPNILHHRGEFVLKFTSPQMDAFKKAALQRFEDGMMHHLRQFAARYAEAMGPVKLRQFIRDGLQRTTAYGIKERGAVRLYLELMMMFGHDFDTDPLLPWGHEVLTNPQFSDEQVKADFLFHSATDYLQQIMGPDGACFQSAIKLGLSSQLHDLPREGPFFEERMAEYFQRLYPERVELAGAHALKMLATRSREAAGLYLPFRDEVPGLLMSLAFSLGHGFERDPRFPWVQSILGLNPSEPASQVQALFEALGTFLQNQLEDQGGKQA